MAVLCSSELGWVLDHEKHINDIYMTRFCRDSSVMLDDSKTSPCGERSTVISTEEKPSCRGSSISAGGGRSSSALRCLQCRPEIFAVHSPFLMDSQFSKLNQSQKTDDVPKDAESSEERKVSPKKRKKRKLESNEGEEALKYFHQQIRNILVKAKEQLLSLAKRKGFFSRTVASHDNNLTSRKAAKSLGPEESLINLCDLATKSTVQNDNPVTKIKEREEKECPNLFNSTIDHNREEVSVMSWLGSQYVLPPGAKFLMSDFTQIRTLLKAEKLFDVVVMDPPWENKSVKRQKKYKTLTDWDLYKLPLPELVKPGSLVVIWMTNKQKQHKFILDKLFPHWSVELKAKWYWLKVTTKGESICDVDSPHKKPYECILIGRYKTDSEKQTDRAADPPNDRVIISVPSSVHSHKPPLNEILKPYLPEKAECLELFARNLLPNWTSWGNEVTTQTCVTLDTSAEERAMILKDAYGDWGICLGRWEGFHQGISGEPGIPGSKEHDSVKGKAGIPGNPGQLSIHFYNLKTEKWHHIQIAEQSCNFSFNIKNIHLSLKSGDMTIQSKSEEVAQNICLGFTIAVLHALCQPRSPLDKGKVVTAPRGSRPVHTIDSESLHVVVAAGYMDDTPCNSYIKNALCLDGIEVAAGGDASSCCGCMA